MYKFNGGEGAKICNSCRTIIEAPCLLPVEDDYAAWANEHACKNCAPGKKRFLAVLITVLILAAIYYFFK